MYTIRILALWTEGLSLKNLQPQLPGRTRLNWDGANMKITNYEAANRWVGKDYREGWNI